MSVIFIQVPLAGMTVKVTKRKTNTSKVILLTVNKDVEVVVTNESAPTPAQPAPPTTAPPTPAPTVPAGKPYTNPLLAGNFGDAEVFPYNGKFYLFATGTPNVHIADEMQGPYVKGPAVLAFKSNIFIGSVFRSKADGRFYAYYSNGYPDFGCGVASSLAPDVLFTDHGLFPALAGCYDGYVFEDDDGKLYYFSNNSVGWLTQVQEMKSPMEPIGTPLVVVRPDQPWEFGRNPGEPGVAEGSFMYKRNGLYNFLYSGNYASRKEEAVGFATTTHPLAVPYKKHLGPIMKSVGSVLGPGHGCFLKDLAGKDWHFYAQKIGAADGYNRRICLDPVEHVDGVPLCIPTFGTSQPGPR